MKRIFTAASLFLLVGLFSSCTGNSYMDVPIFAEYFNELCECEQLDILTMTVCESGNGEREFSTFLTGDGDSYTLLTLIVGTDDIVKSCSVTVTKEKGQLRSADFDALLRVSRSCIAAFTRSSVENADAMLTKLGMTDDSKAIKSCVEYLPEHFFDYCLTADEYGVCFCITNTTLSTQSSEPLTLRQR